MNWEERHLSECIIRELQFYGISMGLGTPVLCVYPLYISLTALLITISYEDYGDVGGGRGWEETHAWVHHSAESERDNPLNNAHAVTAILIGFERKTERMLLTLGRLCKRSRVSPSLKTSEPFHVLGVTCPHDRQDESASEPLIFFGIDARDRGKFKGKLPRLIYR